MIQALILLAVGLFVVALAVNVGLVFKWFGRMSRAERAAMRVWVIMFLALAMFFGREQVVTGVTTLDASAIYQLICVVVAWLLLLPLIGSTSAFRSLDLTSGAMLGYALLAVASYLWSPSQIITLYKAGLFLTDAVLLLVVLSVFRNRGNTAAPLNATYVLSTIFAWGALLGALLWPERALRTLGGALGFILEGTLPQMNPNELGFLGAVSFLVGFRRLFEPALLSVRFFYVAQALVGFVVVFLAQSRTSLAAVAIALAFMAVSIRKMRVIAVSMLAVGAVASLFFISPEAREETASTMADSVVEYTERGHDVLRTLKGRYEGWKIGFRMMADAPVLGHGFDAGVRYLGGLYGFGNQSHMHNSHMQVLVNSGMVGYLFWLVMFIVPVFMAFRSYGGAVFGKTPQERFRAEIFVIVLLIFLRSMTGQILVTHQWSLLLFMGAYVHLRLGRGAELIPARQLKPVSKPEPEPGHTTRTPPRETQPRRLPFHVRLGKRGT